MIFINVSFFVSPSPHQPQYNKYQTPNYPPEIIFYKSITLHTNLPYTLANILTPPATPQTKYDFTGITMTSQTKKYINTEKSIILLKNQ